MISLPEHPLFWKYALASIVIGPLIAALGLLPHDDKSLFRKYLSVLTIHLMYLFVFILAFGLERIRFEKTPGLADTSRLLYVPTYASAMLALTFYYKVFLGAYPAWKRRSIYYFLSKHSEEQEKTPKTDQTS